MLSRKKPRCEIKTDSPQTDLPDASNIDAECRNQTMNSTACYLASRYEIPTLKYRHKKFGDWLIANELFAKVDGCAINSAVTQHLVFNDFSWMYT